MRIPPRIVLGCVALLALSATAPNAEAAYTFRSINTEDVNNAQAGERQLSLSVQALGTTQVVFRFTNAGPAGSMSITDVFFHDNDFGNGPLLGMGTPAISPGVAFALNASLDNLPGGGGLNPAFVTTAQFSAVFPPSGNGVNNPGEALEITFALLNGLQYEDVVAALAAGAAPQPSPGVRTLRIGLLVREFMGSETAQESFVNEALEPVPVPAPAAIVLVASAIPVLGLRRVFRRKTA